MSDSNERRARLIAFYLPQFHPIPENDEWWGSGFTEWTNVVKAKPLYRGHQQPVLAGELGYYDLRVPEVREAQASLARQYGIAAFCYYHYWFGDGRRLLERPFEEVLASGSPDLPFCLCWANESWSGIWHGAPQTTLIEQRYPGLFDHERHFDRLLPAFRDPRYFRVDGKPLFVIYLPYAIPDLAAMAKRWDVLAKQAGLPGIHLVLHQYGYYPKHHDSGIFGGYTTPNLRGPDSPIASRNPYERFKAWVRPRLGHPTIYRYDRIIEEMVKPLSDELLENYPCVMPNWDNTPRSGKRGLVWQGSNPEKFRVPLRAAIEYVRSRQPERRIVFLKSWNEWAEGNFVEPDARFGRGYLEVIDEETRGAT